MTVPTVTSRELNQDIGRAKRRGMSGSHGTVPFPSWSAYADHDEGGRALSRRDHAAFRQPERRAPLCRHARTRIDRSRHLLTVSI